MEFENNEKKHEEPTQQDGFQREVRQGRSPRPRIHTAQRPSFERPNYRQHDDEGGFRPEGFGAGLQSNTPQRGGYRPRNNYEGGYGQQRQGGYGQRPQGGRAAMVSSARVVTASVPSRAAMVSSARAVTASVPSRVAMVSVLRAVTTSVPSRVVTVSPMAHLIRRDLVSILPTMIRMQSTV